MIRRLFIRLTLATLLAGGVASAQPASIDAFFGAFTDEWMRASPSLATSNRYFTGAEQDQLDRQITPLSIAAKRARIALARRGLETLATFDRAAWPSAASATSK